jgi:ketosteroid isomerase-like protein
MTSNAVDHIALAKAYVDASNAHDLERITPMFTADAEYVSSRTGTYNGVPDIIAMMDGFFSQFTDAAWTTADWRQIDGDGVEFDFVLNAGGNARNGVERVFLDDHGRIRRIEVET